MSAGSSTSEALRLPIEGASITVSALLTMPKRPRLLFVLAHGAGAGMQHPFLESTAGLLAGKSIATLRYQFPYMEAGRKRPDPPHLLQATVRSAVAAGVSLAAGVPVVAGGKSMGGRMTSGAAAEGGLAGVSGLLFLGFPLHPPGRRGDQRSRHLEKVALPMLFLQGTRDNLADLDLLRPLCNRLGSRATLHVVEGADHSFRVLKRSGRTDQEVLEELVEAVSTWSAALT